MVPDRRPVRLLAGLAFGLLLTAVAVMSVMDGPSEDGNRDASSVGLLAFVAFIVALCLLSALVSRTGVRALHADVWTLTIVGADGTEEVLSAVDIAFIGLVGRRTGGAVVPGMRSGAWLVVVDHEHRVLTVRRGPGLRPADLARLATYLQVPWIDQVAVVGTYVAPRDPPGDVDPAPRTAGDRRILATFQQLVVHRRQRLRRYLATFALGVASAVLAARAGHVPVVGPLLWVGALVGCTVGFFQLVLAPLNADRVGGIRRAMQGATFELLQAVVVDLRGDRNPRLVGIHAADASMPTTWWMVEQGGEHGWLEGLRSGWYWHGTRPGSVRSVLLPADCSQVALLSARRRDLPVRSKADREFRASRDLEPTQRVRV